MLMGNTPGVIGNYLEMLEDKKALVNADGPDDSHE